jgi:hypothetical protein
MLDLPDLRMPPSTTGMRYAKSSGERSLAEGAATPTGIQVKIANRDNINAARIIRPPGLLGNPPRHPRVAAGRSNR